MVHNRTMRGLIVEVDKPAGAKVVILTMPGGTFVTHHLVKSLNARSHA